MSTNWHYAKSDVSQEPVSIERMKELVQAAAPQPTDLVWHESLPNWIPARQDLPWCKAERVL